MDVEDPEKLFDIFEDHFWHNKEDIIRDITDKLKELGYTTEDVTPEHIINNNEYYINFKCAHGVVLGHIWIYEDYNEGYSFDISDCDADNNLNECPMCKKVKTLKIYNNEPIDDKDKIILDKKTIEEIIKLIEEEEYYIVDKEIIISDEDGIVLTLKDILKGKLEKYKVK